VCPSIRLSVPSIDSNSKQRRAAGLLLSTGAGSKYRSLAAGAQAAAAGSVML